VRNKIQLSAVGLPHRASRPCESGVLAHYLLQKAWHVGPGRLERLPPSRDPVILLPELPCDNSGFIHSPPSSVYRWGHNASGDYHERTSQIAIHFSPKVVLACGNDRSLGRTGDCAGGLKCGRPASRRPTRRWRANSSEKEKEEEKGRASDHHAPSKRTSPTKTTVAPHSLALAGRNENCAS
jgi:hypothetical protein